MQSSTPSNNRPNLLSPNIAQRLNTYKNYSHVMIPKSRIGTKAQNLEYDRQGVLGSLALFNYTKAVASENNQRLALNAPLLDYPAVKEKLRQEGDCSIGALIAASRNGTLGRAGYDYSDFLYCEHLGEMPNNYLITLRRFAAPVGDHINHNYYEFGDSSVSASRNSGKSYRMQKSPADLGRMVTWLGVDGNNMEDILSYNYSMPWSEERAQWQDLQSRPQNAGVLGGLFNMSDAGFQQQQTNGMADPYMGGLTDAGIGATSKIPYVGGAAHSVLGPFFGGGTTAPYNASDFAPWNDNHKPYGPVNVIKKTYINKGDEGLSFSQDISLNFSYELRSYDGINPKSAFLDLIGNILGVTYTTGDFWGGGYRSFGAQASNKYTNLPLFQNGNKPKGFESFIDNVGQALSSMMNSITGGEGLSFDGIMNALSNIGAGVTASLTNKMGRPQRQFMQSLLSPAPTGLWHLTIGNPKHPIMSIGNLIISDCKITHSGPLGLDGFPTHLQVKVTLKHGKPRSAREIEFMYLNGDSRIYSHLGNRYLDVYKNYKATNVKMVSADSAADNMIQQTNEELDASYTDELATQGIAWEKYQQNTGLLPEDSDMLKYSMYKESTLTDSSGGTNSVTKTSNKAAAKKRNK